MTYQYTASPESEIFGGLLAQLHTHINKYTVNEIVRKHHLDDIESDKWYPLQRLFDVFNTVAARDGAMMNFVSIGTAVAEHALLPPEMNDATEQTFWKLWSAGYFYNHRNGAIGALDVEFSQERSVRVVDSTPYPTYHIYGVIYGFTKRFNPTKRHFLIKHDDKAPRKEEGGPTSIFHISW